MLIDKFLSQHIFHISGIEQGILNLINLGIYLCVFDSFRYILDTNHLTSLAGYKIGNGSRSGI